MALITFDDNFMKLKAFLRTFGDRFCFVHLFLSASTFGRSVGRRKPICGMPPPPPVRDCATVAQDMKSTLSGRKDMSTVAAAAAAAAGSVYDDPNQTSKKCTVDLLCRMRKMSGSAESPKLK